MDGRWRIELLGGLRAAQGERVVTRFRTQKTGLLLAYLAFHTTPGSRSHRSFPREQLMELLWPEVERRAGLNHLKATLRWLRQELEPAGVPFGAVLRADRACVSLDPAAMTTDVAEFAAALEAAARAATSAERAAQIARAVDLYQGELLSGCFEEWVLQEREWLAERFFQALGQQIAHLEQAGDLPRALEMAQRGVSLDPLREEAHAELMRLYAAAGQPAAARRQYAELERILKEALDETPSAATRALIGQIERQALIRRSPSALRPPPGPSPTTQPAHARSGTRSTPPAAGENRLVTVLFADMSRSVETMRDLHPEAGEPRFGHEVDSGPTPRTGGGVGTLGRAPGVALINRLFGVMVDAVLQYEGQVDRFLGDGMLAVFGLLQAHEDDAERAIRAALAIREGARKLGLEVTAGINTGPVYVGQVGSEQHRERTVVGPVVNLAARFQEQARPGQLLVGEATHYQSRRAFQFAARSLTLQGFPQPVPAYAVEGVLSRPQKARGLEGLRAELIGRERELAQLQEALAAVQNGQGQIVSLIGEAGVGKSRLVAELRQGMKGELPSRDREGAEGRRAAAPLPHGRGSDPASPPLWLEGRCLELQMTTGYSLFLDLLRGYFDWGAEAGERERVERLLAVLQAFVERGDLSAERAEEMAPLLRNLFALRSGTDWDLRLKNASPQQIRHQSLVALQEFFVALARRQPVALVLEDLHWADPLSLDLLSLLMEALSQAPLLLLCVYRPEHEHRCWQLASIASRKCPERFTELTLRELTPAQSRRLVQSLLGSEELPAAVTERVLQEAQGNPFFVEEVIQALIEAGTLYRDAQGWRVREEKAGASVPASVQSVILCRLDRLEREERQVLERASVLGRLFRRRLLEGIAAPEGGIERVLWELEQRGLIYQERVVPEEEYSFKHVLTQETIYGSLLRRQRSALHQQVGEAIERLYRGELEEQYEPLAYHYERSEADEKAVEYLLKAGEKARRAYLNEEAIGYFQRALERLERPALGETRQEWQLEARQELGKTYHLIGKSSEAAEQLSQAIATGREIDLPPRQLVRLYWWFGDVLYRQSRYDEVIRLGEEGLALLREAGGAEGGARGPTGTVGGRSLGRLPPEGRAGTREAGGGPDPGESVEAALMNSLIAVSARRKGDQGQWREFTLRNAQLIRRLPYTEELRGPYDQIVRVYASLEKDPAEAMRWVQALRREGEKTYDLRALGEVHDKTGWLLASSGDLRGAIVPHQQLLELCAKTEDLPVSAWALGSLANDFLWLGNLQEAAENAVRSHEILQRYGNKVELARSHMIMGTIRLCQGHRNQATDAFQAAADLWREIGNGRSEAGAIHALGRVSLAQGRRQEAVAHFKSAIALTGCAAAEELSGLESACEDPDVFCAFCRGFRAEHPAAGASSLVHWYLEPTPAWGTTGMRLPLVQWYLEPTQPRGFSGLRAEVFRAAYLSPDWVWQDPFGDCSFTVKKGLEIHAANGRDLWHLNLSAPRLLRPAAGEFAMQTVCLPLTPDQPAIGGILLWKGKENFLRLDRGTRGPPEVSFQGCLGNQDVIIGRGRLPAERMILRLERLGPQVRALCSADGEEWFTVGDVEFPIEDPLEVGLHAIGSIDRTLYPGAYPEGTAIRFESFELWANSE